MAKTKKTSSKKPRLAISKVNRQIAIGFVLVTIILLLIITYFSLSQATILITPEKKPIETNLTIEVLPDITSTLTGSNILPGQIKITESSSTDVFSASQEKQINTKSEGKVTIINNYSKKQTLVATTRLLSENGLLFRIKKTIVVPAKGKTEVEIEADEIGKQYEIGPGKFTIPGLWEGLQDKIYGISDKPMSPSSIKQKIVTLNDLDTAKQELLKKIKDKAANQSSNKDNYVLVDTKIITTNSNVKAGSKADKFNFTVTSQVATITFNKDDIYRIAENTLKASTSDSLEYLSYNPDSLKIKLKQYDPNGQAATLEVSLQGLATVRLNDTFRKKDILGFAKQDVEHYFLNIPGISSVQVNFTPAWVKSVPPLEDHVKIKIIK